MDEDRSFLAQLLEDLAAAAKQLRNMEQKFTQSFAAVKTGQENAVNGLLESVCKDWSGRGSHVDFQSIEKVPLKETRWLGRGMNGDVMETTCKGITLAWKRKLYRYKYEHEALKEIEILKKLRHHHIVTLVGTYTHQRLLGILIWPVAQCDLSTVLDYLDVYGRNRDLAQEDAFLDDIRRLELGVEELRHIVGDQDQRIWSSFGCLTGAISYLHDNSIRHKDIKPSNILLSRDGIWLTDFGNARDFSAELASTTEGGGRGTLKYCAPEVASYGKNSRSADIFSLGCVFLEIMVVLTKNHTLEDLRKLRPEENGSYQGNLQNVDRWLSLAESRAIKPRHLLCEIKQMLEHDRTRRPTAATLVSRLGLIEQFNDDQLSNRFYGPCCTSPQEQELNTQKEAYSKLNTHLKNSQQEIALLVQRMRKRKTDEFPVSMSYEKVVKGTPLPAKKFQKYQIEEKRPGIAQEITSTKIQSLSEKTQSPIKEKQFLTVHPRPVEEKYSLIKWIQSSFWKQFSTQKQPSIYILSSIQKQSLIQKHPSTKKQYSMETVPWKQDLSRRARPPIEKLPSIKE